MVLVADEAEENDVILLRRFIEDLSNPVDMVSDGSALFLLIVEQVNGIKEFQVFYVTL